MNVFARIVSCEEKMLCEIPQTMKNWDLKENFFLRGYNPGFLRAYIHHFKGRLGSEKAIYFP